MSIFQVISVAVPLVLAILLPRLLVEHTPHERRARPLLYVACILFLISWYLPSPLIDGQDTSFVTHFVGGGLFTGFLWIYVKHSFGWRRQWIVEAILLFAFVSTLGSINELIELFFVRTHIAHILLSDTNWDILANTLGAATVFIGYKVYDRWC